MKVLSSEINLYSEKIQMSSVNYMFVGKNREMSLVNYLWKLINDFVSSKVYLIRKKIVQEQKVLGYNRFLLIFDHLYKLMSFFSNQFV